ncbi:MAG: sigma 54-dependent transcriptional regulator, partial [Myxococcota bacterium]
ERPEDIEPNLIYELERFAEVHGQRASFNKDAPRRFLTFARSDEARWRRNFRDFNAAVVRMATLAPGGRIDVPTVNEEIERLNASWRPSTPGADHRTVVSRHLGASATDALDRFDLVQLADVLRVCEASGSMSEAGRTLFAVSRTRRTSTNDSDRLRKYLKRFDLTWDRIQPRQEGSS